MLISSTTAPDASTVWPRRHLLLPQHHPRSARRQRVQQPCYVKAPMTMQRTPWDAPRLVPSASWASIPSRDLRAALRWRRHSRAMACHCQRRSWSRQAAHQRLSSSTPVAFTSVATRGQAPNVRQRASTAVAEDAVAAFRARMCTLVWAVASTLCLRARVRLDRLAFVDASSIETLKSDPVLYVRMPVPKAFVPPLSTVTLESTVRPPPSPTSPTSCRAPVLTPIPQTRGWSCGAL